MQCLPVNRDFIADVEEEQNPVENQDLHEISSRLKYLMKVKTNKKLKKE